jgi:serine protease Do
VQELTPDLAKQLGFDDGVEGVVVVGVKADSPAASAGVKQSDLIEKVGRINVHGIKDFQDAVKEHSLKEGIVLHLRTSEGRRFVIVQSAEE